MGKREWMVRVSNSRVLRKSIAGYNRKTIARGMEEAY